MSRSGVFRKGLKGKKIALKVRITENKKQKSWKFNEWYNEKIITIQYTLQSAVALSLSYILSHVNSMIRRPPRSRKDSTTEIKMNKLQR